jgi:hypothetical protein
LKKTATKIKSAKSVIKFTHRYPNAYNGKFTQTGSIKTQKTENEIYTIK